MGELAIQAEKLGKRFRLGVGAPGQNTLRERLTTLFGTKAVERQEVWALRGLDLEVDRGEVLGIVGPNGAGKTTLLRILARITYPTEGRARTRGVVGSLLDVGTGFHFELTGRENIFLSGTVLGMRRDEIRSRFDEIVEFSGVERFLDTPVKRYSEGMRLRLAFAVAAHLEPPIVVVDEVLAVGDAAFREKCMGKMAEMGRRDRTVLFVSHELGAITKLCSRAIWLDHGGVRADGPPRTVVSSYLEQVSADQSLDVEFGDDPGASVAVRRVAVRDVGQNRTLTALQRGQEFRLELSFVVRERIPGLEVALLLVDELGTVIIDTASGDDMVDRGLSGEPGNYVVSIVVPPLLGPGRYTVRGWVGNEYEEFVDRALTTFRVDPRPDDAQRFTDRISAVQPEISWQSRREPI